ncbi:hypothetical protein A2U01_0024649, partial [Trifolium medium]|nr:hypothetical protein [Trifolium medium]
LQDRTDCSMSVGMQPDEDNWPQRQQHKMKLIVALVVVEEVVV